MQWHAVVCRCSVVVGVGVGWRERRVEGETQGRVYIAAAQCGKRVPAARRERPELFPVGRVSIVTL